MCRTGEQNRDLPLHIPCDTADCVKTTISVTTVPCIFAPDNNPHLNNGGSLSLSDVNFGRSSNSTGQHLTATVAFSGPGNCKTGLQEEREKSK